MSTKRIRVIFVLGIIVIVTLLFGLWPLNLWPKNEVNCLQNERGIELHRSGIDGKYTPRGILYTEESIQIPSKNESARDLFTIEIYLRSGKEPQLDIGTIMAFDPPEKLPTFLAAQWKKWLIIRTPEKDSRNINKYKEIGISNALPLDSTRYIAITSGPFGTKLYLNAVLKKRYPFLFLIDSEKKIDGRLIIGSSTNGEKPWAGSIFGLAVHQDTLKTSRIIERFHAWQEERLLDLHTSDHQIALYTFNRKESRIIYNEVSNKYHLQIPNRYVILEKTILELPWKGFSLDFSLFFDMIINLFGFIPLGIALTCYLGATLPRMQLLMAVLLLGGSLSLFIELVQIFMY